MQLILLGGFLGSGKTTAIQNACLQLRNKDIRVGVITNDQGGKLVDSAFIKGFQLPGKEVVNGCFCCNYTQLEKGILSLTKVHSPDIIFAESVGSCTDIVATVIKPLLKSYPSLKIIYPVFVDILSLFQKIQKNTVLPFDEDIAYIYEKQLEEADFLVLNKSDLLSDIEQTKVENWLKDILPGKHTLFQNSLEPEDIKKWIETLAQFEPEKNRKSLNLDYKKYGKGEKKLAWLDRTIRMSTPHHNAVDLATQLTNNIFQKMKEKGYPIGHLKFLLSSGSWQKKISYTSIDEPILKQTHSLLSLRQVQILMNARVQTTPKRLENSFAEVLNQLKAKQTCNIEMIENTPAFRPGYPKPEHRIG